MPIKFADEIIKDIEKRGAVKIPNGNLTGEEFEKWLKNNLFMKELMMKKGW